MIKYLHYILFLLILSGIWGNAQMQTAHWYFGERAGVDFTSGTPVEDIDGQLSTVEGCTAISDEYGNLLLYSDGVTVYDRNHNIMPNGTGLYGHSSSTQSAIVVPKPGDCNLYYLFTIYQKNGQSLEQNHGLNYSIIDMSLNGGYGEVVEKNIPVPIAGGTYGFEKLTATVNADRNGYWIVTHFLNNFYSFKLTEDGVDLNPVISPTSINGGYDDLEYFNGIGYIKISLQGNRLALAYGRNEVFNMSGGRSVYGSLSLYSFDNITGIVNDETVIYPPSTNRNYLGVEFSPNGQLLYATGMLGLSMTKFIHQYNLNASSIPDSEFILQQNTDPFLEGALQLGLDGNIYTRAYNNRYLAKIENPDIAYNAETGDSPTYIGNAVNLFRIARSGLPQFLNYYFRTAITVNDVAINEQPSYCPYTELDFNFCSQGGIIESIHWDFGDGNTSEEMYPQYYYNSPGTYTIKLTLIVGGEEYIRTFEITITGPPNVENAEQSVCKNAGESHPFNLEDSLSGINPENGNFIITFHLTEEEAENNENPQPSTYTTFSTTTIWVRVEDELGCFVIRELELIVNLIPELTIETPIEICTGSTTTLEVTTLEENTIYWYDSENSETPIFTGTDYETDELFVDTSFWVEAVSEEECKSQRIKITVIVTDEIEPQFSQIPAICAGESLEELPTESLNGITGTWFPELDNTQTTIYIFIPDNGQCAEDYEMTIFVNPVPDLTIETPAVTICAGETATLTVVTNGETVNWYETETSEIVLFEGNSVETEPLFANTIFWVEAVSEEGCISGRREVVVTVNSLPELTVEEPNSVCVGSTTTLYAASEGNLIYWYDSEDSQTPISDGNTFETAELFADTSFWVEAVSDENCKSGRIEIPVTVTDETEPQFTQIPAICAGETLEELPTTSLNGITGTWIPGLDNTVTTSYTFTPDDGQCALPYQMTITVNLIPDLTIETPAVTVCAGETAVLSVVSNGQTINWYETETSETILFEGNGYETIPLFETTTFWVEAITRDCSTARESVTVTVNPMPDVFSEDTVYWCDSLNNGFEHVDLTQNNIILSNNPEVFLNYYMDDDEQFPIDNPAYFLIDSSPRVVYVSAAAGDCKVVVPLTITLTEAPVVSDTSLQICSPDGIGIYELTDANESIIINSNSYTITYHLSYEEAKEDINPLPGTYENTSTNQTVFARVEEGENCFNIAEIALTYNNTFATITPLEECDDDSDGFTIFDLTEKEPEISAIFGGSGYSFIYYTSLENAYENVNEIPNPENYTNITNPQTIHAKVLSGDVCLGIVSFDLIAVQIPEIGVETEITLCPGDEYPIEAPSGYESYTWTNPNGIVISTTNSAILDTEGIYILEITFSDNSCTFREEIEVVFDNAPVVTNIEVNGTSVIITATGTLPLEYSIDGGQTWQSPNVFYDVPYGEYESIVRNANGCESGIYPVVVFELTNIITPNSDGYNDTWVILALVNYPGSTLKIVDRYGKILVNTNLETGFIWDGKYNGNPLPSTSYWYFLDLGNGQKMTGSVTVKNY